MIGSAVASPATTISSGIYSRRSGVSFPSGLPSPSRKFFPTSSIFYPIEKKIVSLTTVAVEPLTTKVESQTNTKKQNQKNTITLSSTLEDVFFSKPKKTTSSSRKEKNPKRLSSSGAHRTFLLPVIRYPLGTESAIRAILEHNTLVFVVDERADKNSIKETVKNVFKVRAKKVNTAITPDGTKKAFVMLAPDFSALDLAKKLKIL